MPTPPAAPSLALEVALALAAGAPTERLARALTALESGLRCAARVARTGEPTGAVERGDAWSSDVPLSLTHTLHLVGPEAPFASTLDALSPVWPALGAVAAEAEAAESVAIVERTAERELERERERLEAVLNTTSAIIYTATLPDFRVDYVSESARTVLGFTTDEFRSPGFWERMVHPDDRARVLANLGGLFERGHHVHEYRHRRHDGSYVWLRDEVRIVMGDAGQPVGAVGASFDITSRKQSEQHLATVLHWQRALLDLSHELARAHGYDALFVTLGQHLASVLTVDRASIMELRDDCLQMRAIAEAERAGAAASPLRPPSHRSALGDAAILRAFDQQRAMTTREHPLRGFPDWLELHEKRGYRQIANLPLVGADGALGTLNLALLRAEPWTDEELDRAAQVASLLSAHLVILQAREALVSLNADLERRVDERTLALRASEERFERLFEEAPQAMLIVDGAHRVTQSNRNARALFGYDRHELDGLPLEALVPEGHRAGHGEHVARYFSDRLPKAMARDRVVKAKRSSGQVFAAEIGLVPLSLDSGRHVLAGVSDVSARLAAQEAVATSLREKETLLKEIHHRVKNNLQIISSLLMLQSEQVPSSEARSLLAESVYRVRSMALVHQHLYGMESLERVELGEYVRALTESLRATLAPDARVAFETADVEVAVDLAIPLGLLLNELLTNAFKYGFAARSEASGEAWDVSVSLRRDSLRASVMVADMGPGLPASLEPRRASTLGMQLMHTLNRQLRGTLCIGATRAHETRPGATFEVSFPLASAGTSDPRG